MDSNTAEVAALDSVPRPRRAKTFTGELETDFFQRGRMLEDEEYDTSGEYAEEERTLETIRSYTVRSWSRLRQLVSRSFGGRRAKEG